MFETGCSYSEILGLESEDVDLNKFNPYIIIRSNSLRQIKNVYKEKDNTFGWIVIAYNSENWNS